MLHDLGESCTYFFVLYTLNKRGPSVVLLELVDFTSNEITLDIFEKKYKIPVMDELISGSNLQMCMFMPQYYQTTVVIM